MNQEKVKQIIDKVAKAGTVLTTAGLVVVEVADVIKRKVLNDGKGK